MEFHKYIFFGHSFNLIVYSISKYDPHVYFKWRKRNFKKNHKAISNENEKDVEFNLENLTHIYSLLKNPKNPRRITIKEANKGETVKFSWEDDTANRLWIRVNKFLKVLTFSQVQLLILLTEHLLHEKIVYATSNSNGKKFRLLNKNKANFQKKISMLHFE